MASRGIRGINKAHVTPQSLEGYEEELSPFMIPHLILRDASTLHGGSRPGLVGLRFAFMSYSACCHGS